MNQITRWTMLVFSTLAVLFFASDACADSLTYSGTAPDGTAVSGSLTFTAVPDGLGDGGLLVTGISSGSLTLEGSTYNVSGLTPLNGSPSPTQPGYDAYYMSPGYHYDGYDNLLYPGTSKPVDSLLFFAGLGQPANLYCRAGQPCYLGIWIGQGSVIQNLFPNGGNNPPDNAFENFTITFQEGPSVPEPSTQVLLGSGLGLLILAAFARRT